MLLCYYSPGHARGRPGWSGADASTRKYFVQYSTLRKIVSAQRSGPLSCPFSCSYVSSPCSMACSIDGAESAKNAYIWTFSAVLIYANVSIIVPGCADLGPFPGLRACPMISPGWYFFHRRPPHVSPHSPIFGQNLIDGCAPYTYNSHASHKNGSIFGFHLIISIIPLSHIENGFQAAF